MRACTCQLRPSGDGSSTLAGASGAAVALGVSFCPDAALSSFFRPCLQPVQLHHPSSFRSERPTLPPRTASPVSAAEQTNRLERDAGNPGVERLNGKGEKRKRNKQSRLKA
ncbi:hypothetical protein CapIbe_007344 [Capra ibex]